MVGGLGSVFGWELLGRSCVIYRLFNDADGFIDFDVICNGQPTSTDDQFAYQVLRERLILSRQSLGNRSLDRFLISIRPPLISAIWCPQQPSA
jgi:hypothetical protein